MEDHQLQAMSDAELEQIAIAIQAGRRYRDDITLVGLRSHAVPDDGQRAGSRHPAIRKILSDFVLMSGQFCPTLPAVRGAEFIRIVSKLARKRGVETRVIENRGKGSHITLYYGDRFTVVKDRTKELAPGLLHAMLKQLGLYRDDLT
jgi:mRNA interferase HicA